MRSLLLAALFSSVAVSAFAQAHDLPSPDRRAVPANHPGEVKAKTPVQIEADRVAAYQRVLGLEIGTPAASATTATQAPSAQAPLAPSGLQPVSVYSARTAGGLHTVVKKDTLYNISKRYGVTLDALKQANQLPDSRIQLGQNLVIPMQKQAAQETSSVPVTVIEPVALAPNDATRLAADTGRGRLKAYAVASGDTLAAISRRTCVSQQRLIGDNSLTDPNALRPGQVLALPSDHCLTK
jgi:LysM repeat protein